jgi:hypothetical protein
MAFVKEYPRELHRDDKPLCSAYVMVLGRYLTDVMMMISCSTVHLRCEVDSDAFQLLMRNDPPRYRRGTLLDLTERRCYREYTSED